MKIEDLEKQIVIEREKLNQLIIDNDLNMSCESVLAQSRIVDVILTKLMTLNS